MAVGTVTVTIYNSAWASQGTVTSAFLPKGSFLRNDAGEGSFVFPIYDTPAKTLVQYNRIAVVTVEESGGATAVVAAFHIQHIKPQRIRSGAYDGYVEEVSGPGILAELQWDNLGYATISDGSQGSTSDWLTDIISGYAQNSWSIYGMGSGSGPDFAYLKAAGESLYDAILECASQNGMGITYFPFSATKSPGRWIGLLEAPLAGAAILDWDNLDIVKSGPTGDQVVVLDIKPIEDSHEIATRVTIYGAGIGADVLTIAAAEGNVTVPTGFSVDWANSIITNDTLEAATDQPIMHRLHQLGHIKPEDNQNTTAVETAAIQLFWAGISFLRDRDAVRRQSYEVTFLAYPGYNYAVGQLANLVYAESSPIDAAGASNATNVININDDFVVHEMHIQVPNSGEHKGLRVITMVLGEQTSSEAYIRPLPSDGDVVVKKLKEHDEVLRHATASYAPTSPGGTPTYATADAPFLVLSNTTNLTNERRLVFDTDFTVNDGGANGDYDVSLNAGTGSLHAPVTLAIGLDNNLLALTGQQLGLDTQSANTVFAGPSSGVAVAPAFRALVDADIPASIARSAITITAGAGLTNGGDLSANRTIDVATADTSMTINADSIQVRLAATSGLTVSTGLMIDDSIAGAGLTISSKVLAVGTPSSLGVSTANAVTTSSHTHATDASIAAAMLFSALKRLPGLVAMYPMSHTPSNQLTDVVGGFHLTNNNTAVFDADTSYRNYVTLNGTTQYFSIADASFTEIVGTETYIASARRGLTIMAAVRFDSAASPGTPEFICAKRGSLTASRGFGLQRNGDGTLGGTVHNGTTENVVNTSQTLGGSTWGFVCFRYDPSASVEIRLDGNADASNTTSIISSINNNSEPFTVGARSDGAGGGSLFAGLDIGFLVVCRAVIQDEWVDWIQALSDKVY